MGSYISASRDSLFQPFAFPLPKCSYDNYMEGLNFVDNIPIYLKHSNKDSPTLLFSHGNACDLGHTKSLVDELSKKLSVNVISYDYPGYGLCPCESNEK